MDDSLAGWLRLREPADIAARSDGLTQQVAATVAARACDTVHVLDLATGTGSNVRYLTGRLPGQQSWLVVDHDPRLLQLAPAGTSTCRVETKCLDLGALTPELFGGRHLVAGSALLDLVSEAWLRALAGHCRAVGAAALFALSYDGRSTCSPVEPEDDTIRELLNRHQGRDKGLGGPAAGPSGAACAERCFADAGYIVRTARSDWKIGSTERALQRHLIEGWAAAAKELAPGEISSIDSWLTRRLRHVEADRSRVVVGHVDVAAWLP